MMGMLPGWLASVIAGAARAPAGRRIGAGISSRLFAAHHAVARREASKYPDAVSINKTERMKQRKRLEQRLRREGRVIA